MGAILAGLFRHLLTTAGGALLASGYVTAQQSSDVLNAVNGFQGNAPEIVGAAATVIGVGASIWSKYKKDKK